MAQAGGVDAGEIVFGTTFQLPLLNRIALGGVTAYDLLGFAQDSFMILSVLGIAIFAAIPMAAWSPVPQAWISVTPGVVGASLVPRTASRARFQSRECETTARTPTSTF